MEKVKNYDNSDESEEDLIFITVAKYKLFLSHGKAGMDAYLLYMHLMFLSRVQKTYKITTKDLYLRKELKWGASKLLKAKILLLQLCPPEIIQAWNGDGNEW